MTRIKNLADAILEAETVTFTGPHTNKSLADYESNKPPAYVNISEAQVACKLRNDCSGVTQESIFTLRQGLSGLINSTSGEDSWQKSLFSGPHTNKSLAGYVSSGTYVYANISDAQVACGLRTDCSGVTQESNYTLRQGLSGLISSTLGETSWQKSLFSGPHTNKSLAGYVSSGTYVYANISEAQVACQVSNNCSGVTHKYIFTLRKFANLSVSTSGEDSWVKGFRKVRVQLEGTDQLSMSEVQVFDQNGTNVALNKTATQSGTPLFPLFLGVRYPASNAVNGDVTDFGSLSRDQAGK
jgi:hypothetical protein